MAKTVRKVYTQLRESTINIQYDYGMGEAVKV